MASINDVAKLAKVSKSTVSLVINKTGYVSEETKKRVEDAIKKLNYTPSRLAQGLSTNHSGLIAVVVPDAAHPFFSTLVKSIEQTLAKQEYMTIVCSAKENEETEKWYIEMLNRKIVDGIITAGHTIDQSAYQCSERPIVSIDRYINDTIPIVQSNHGQAAKYVAQILWESGCKRVAQFTGTPNINVQSHGFNIFLTEELKKKGIHSESVYIGHNTFHLDEYISSAKKLFDSDIQFDSIVGVDPSILACIQEATKRKLRVPQDIKMVSYDGTYITRLHSPIITSVVQPIEQIGECSANLIVKLIDGQKLEQNKYIFPVYIQKGETCK